MYSLYCVLTTVGSPVLAFTPSLRPATCNSRQQSSMFTAVENTADSMFFADVGAKDPKTLGTTVEKTSKANTNTKRKPNKKKKAVKAVVSKVKAEKGGKNEVKSKNGEVNRKKNDPKPHGKKKFKAKGRPNKNREKKFLILPLSDLKLGSKITGRVAAFTDFGIFIKINYSLKDKNGRGGGYALLHKSQIRDEPVKDLKKLFRIGAVVKDLRVLTVDYEKGEVGLSLREKREERKSLSEFTVGKEYVGKVARIVNYGAFIELGAKANALLHISRVSQKKIKNIRNWLNEGDSVSVRIIDIDEKKNTMAASMLESGADEYLDRRNEQIKKKRHKSGKNTDDDAAEETDSLKTELEYFTDAVQELEQALG